MSALTGHLVPGFPNQLRLRTAEGVSDGVFFRALPENWGVPEMGVPYYGWFTVENPIKWMIWGYFHFGKPPDGKVEYYQVVKKCQKNVDFNIFQDFVLECVPLHLIIHQLLHVRMNIRVVSLMVSQRSAEILFPTENFRKNRQRRIPLLSLDTF